MILELFVQAIYVQLIHIVLMETLESKRVQQIHHVRVSAKIRRYVYEYIYFFLRSDQATVTIRGLRNFFLWSSKCFAYSFCKL